jgi:transglutaminase-like putative cysteine protease
MRVEVVYSRDMSEINRLNIRSEGVAEVETTQARTDDPAAFLGATWFIDTEHPRVREFAEWASDGADDDIRVAQQLFVAVRDSLRYTPYSVRLNDLDNFRASSVLTLPATWCVPKAVVLTAVARAQHIPARLGFADVKNHLSSEKLSSLIRTDLFRWHGYTELFVDGKWTKVSPAFNRELCARFGVEPIEFDGSHDALMHAFDGNGTRFMEYVNDHGAYADLPYEQMTRDLRRHYSYMLSILEDGGPIGADELMGQPNG